MKQLIFITIAVILTIDYTYAQKPNADPKVNRQQILLTVQGFLQWYKNNHQDIDTTRLIKGGPPDSTTRPSIDWNGVERYLSKLNNSGLVTPAYLNTQREYFKAIDKELEGFKPSSELTKINGMDGDLILHIFEPEAIFESVSKGKIHQIAIIYRKAIISYQLSPYICLLFTLTYDTKWQIDSIGYDNSHKDSLGAM
ncbi:hypothetical protein LT679_17875 [Mucilaginibacter roseus]|uniref:DUF3828 domain-containing protein n=1 Tax=Mucilaginibacter roseus TaxID=1528868 RepID=A0ABS8U8Y4_9SPHI|nr:hypothetical protein [Mucilaginibacter roseus]MCD8742484.1 hypothetical protein [Mucilaginibacter roseus]